MTNAIKKATKKDITANGTDRMRINALQDEIKAIKEKAMQEGRLVKVTAKKLDTRKANLINTEQIEYGTAKWTDEIRDGDTAWND